MQGRLRRRIDMAPLDLAVNNEPRRTRVHRGHLVRLANRSGMQAATRKGLRVVTTAKLYMDAWRTGHTGARSAASRMKLIFNAGVKHVPTLSYCSKNGTILTF